MFFRIENVVQKIEKFIVIVLLMIMFVAVIMQVMARYFNLPLIDTTEISLMNMSLLTFIGAGFAVYSRDHIAIEITDLIKSERLKMALELMVTIVYMVFALVFLYLGYSLFAYSLGAGETTLELRIPLAVPNGTLLIGMALMLFHAVGNLLRLFSGKNSYEKSDPKQ